MSINSKRPDYCPTSIIHRIYPLLNANLKVSKQHFRDGSLLKGVAYLVVYGCRAGSGSAYLAAGLLALLAIVEGV